MVPYIYESVMTMVLFLHLLMFFNTLESILGGNEMISKLQGSSVPLSDQLKR